MPYIPHTKGRLRDEAELAILAYRASARPVIKLPPSLAPVCAPAAPRPPQWLAKVLRYTS